MDRKKLGLVITIVVVFAGISGVILFSLQGQVSSSQTKITPEPNPSPITITYHLSDCLVKYGETSISFPYSSGNNVEKIQFTVQAEIKNNADHPVTINCSNFKLNVLMNQVYDPYNHTWVLDSSTTDNFNLEKGTQQSVTLSFQAVQCNLYTSNVMQITGSPTQNFELDYDSSVIQVNWIRTQSTLQTVSVETPTPTPVPTVNPQAQKYYPQYLATINNNYDSTNGYTLTIGFYNEATSLFNQTVKVSYLSVDGTWISLSPSYEKTINIPLTNWQTESINSPYYKLGSAGTWWEFQKDASLQTVKVEAYGFK